MNRIFFIAAVIFVTIFAPRVFANQTESMAVTEIRRHEISLQRPLTVDKLREENLS